MAKSSIHIAPGASGYFAHNSRERQTKNSIFSDEQNFCSCTKKEAFEIYKSELQKRAEAYTNRTGQKLQKKAITHLSAIVNLNKEHTEKDLKKVCDYLEKTFDTKVIQYSIHRDEGHIDENGTAHKNYHAHIEFLGLDSEGKSIRRKLTKKALIDLQDKVAELLQMKRGVNYTKERKRRPKRLDTYEYKAHKEQEAYNFREMQKKITALTELTTEQKKELHRLNSKVRKGEATIDKLREQIDSMQRENAKIEKQLEKKDKQIEDAKTEITELKDDKEFADKEIVEIAQQLEAEPFAYSIKEAVKSLYDKIKSLTQELLASKKLINSLKLKNKHLEEENIKLQEKIAQNSNTSDLDTLSKDLKEQLKRFKKKEELTKTDNPYAKDYCQVPETDSSLFVKEQKENGYEYEM